MILNFTFKLLLIFIFSIVLNLFLFIIVKSGFLGYVLQNKIYDLLKNKIHLFFIIPFFISFFLLTILNNNIVYLDEKEVIVTAIVDNGKFIFSGDALNFIFDNLGSAAVFSTGARIAAGLLAKHPMHLLPKTGIIGGVGSGFTIAFKIINNNLPKPNIEKVNSIIETGQVTVKIENLQISDNKMTKSLLEKYFKTNKINDSNFNLIKNNNNIIEINGNEAQTKSVIEELDYTIPTWKDNFINSPIETSDLLSDESIKQFLIDSLTNNLILQFIILYLMIMVIIILTCKLIIEKNIQLTNIKNYPLGNNIYYIFNKYISIWHSTGNFWIYVIIFSVIIFIIVLVYSNYQIISYLKLYKFIFIK